MASMAQAGDTNMAAAAEARDVGRMVDSGQADDRRMIRLVKERRLLYARNNMPVASYYSRVKGLWREVADEMGWSVVDVRRKWSHIRNSYSRHLRNEMHGARTGKGRMVSRWYLADDLEFLREHMATDMRPSPFSTYAPSLLELELPDSKPEPADMKPFIGAPWFGLGGFEPRAEPRAEPAPADRASDLDQRADDSCCSSAFEPDENSSFFQFFRGIHMDYQELSAKQQRLFKRRCLDFLHELLDQAEAERAPGAINLSAHAHAHASRAAAPDSASDDERDHKAGILERAGAYVLPADP